MNDADKIEISNLLNGIDQMKELLKKKNEKYVDEKVAEFAEQARADYKANKEYVLDIVGKNPQLFFNLKNMSLNRSEINRPVWIYGQSNLRFLVIASNCTQIDWEHHDVGHLEFKDVQYSTSDTSLPEYSTCCWENLLDSVEKGWNMKDFKVPMGAKQWDYLYSLSLRTRGMNELLVKHFKDTLTIITNQFKESVNKVDKSLENTKNIPTYTRVAV